MDYIKVVLADWMPLTVRAFTAYCYDEGQAYYTIFINACLNSETQCAAYDHEMCHINSKDFSKMVPVEDLEAERHQMVM